MEQKPVHGAGPLAPPAADVATAYLDEVGTLARRREERIDRRMLGRLHLIDGLVVGALFSAALFVMRSAPSNAHLWLLVILALTPLGISVIAFGVLALRQWRRASVQERASASQGPEPFTRASAIGTIAMGLVLAGLIVATGVSDPVAGSVMAAVLLCVVLVLTVATRSGSWLPVLGRIWRRPQWTALLVTGALFLASLVLGAGMAAPTRFSAAAAMGALTALLFVVVAVRGFRRADVREDHDVEYGGGA